MYTLYHFGFLVLLIFEKEKKIASPKQLLYYLQHWNSYSSCNIRTVASTTAFEPFSSHSVQCSSKWAHPELEQKREEENDSRMCKQLPWRWNSHLRNGVMVQACKDREGDRGTEGQQPYLTGLLAWKWHGCGWEHKSDWCLLSGSPLLACWGRVK